MSETFTARLDRGRGAGAMTLAWLAACGGRTTLAQCGQTPATPSKVTFFPQFGQTTIGIKNPHLGDACVARARTRYLGKSNDSAKGGPIGAEAAIGPPLIFR